MTDVPSKNKLANAKILPQLTNQESTADSSFSKFKKLGQNLTTGNNSANDCQAQNLVSGIQAEKLVPQALKTGAKKTIDDSLGNERIQILTA